MQLQLRNKQLGKTYIHVLADSGMSIGLAGIEDAHVETFLEESLSIESVDMDAFNNNERISAPEPE